MRLGGRPPTTLALSCTHASRAFKLRMKTKITIGLLAGFIWTASSSGQLLFDDFNGVSINTAFWTPSLPFGFSQVFESGGRAVMVGRGGLDSLQSFPTSIDITGRFRFTGQEDHFGLTLRSDLVVANAFQEKHGLRISFQENSQSLRITEYNTDNSITELAFLSYPLAVNTDYDFRITDAGNTIRLYMMGSSTPTIEGSSSFRAGDKIAIYNREFSISRSELDFITVVPEPSGVFVFGLVVFGAWQNWRPKSSASSPKIG